jgi:hypothetical protein
MALEPLKLDKETPPHRSELLNAWQKFLVARVQDYFSLERIKFDYDASKTIWEMVHRIFEIAVLKNKSGQVAEYLVGAKLAIRFPNIKIENKSFSTSDHQTGRPGDFLIKDTAFHVTVHPTAGHFAKCIQNINQGFRPCIIVPNRLLDGTRQLAELEAPGKITISSLEGFVSQNIDELAVFSSNEAARQFGKLLEIYNERVDAVEDDKSLLIEMPHQLVE